MEEQESLIVTGHSSSSARRRDKFTEYSAAHFYTPGSPWINKPDGDSAACSYQKAKNGTREINMST